MPENSAALCSGIASYVINTEKGGQTGGVALVLHNLVTRSGRFKHKLNLKVKEVRPSPPPPEPQPASCSLARRPRPPLVLQALADPRNTLPFPTLWLPLAMPSLPFDEFSFIFQNSTPVERPSCGHLPQTPFPVVCLYVSPL